MFIKVTVCGTLRAVEKHGALWGFVDRLSIERGDEELFNFFGEANALHRNFYEDEMTHKAIEVIARDIEKLTTKLKEASK